MVSRSVEHGNEPQPPPTQIPPAADHLPHHLPRGPLSSNAPVEPKISFKRWAHLYFARCQARFGESPRRSLPVNHRRLSSLKATGHLSMHLILTGATGIVGSGVLTALLSTTTITRISILSRRPLPVLASRNPEKINIIVHSDYHTYPSEVLDQLKGAKGCIWAQGISSNGMNEKDYKEITLEYPVAAAKAFSTLAGGTEKGKERFNFVYVSGEGATLNPGYLTPLFGKVKGQAEMALAKLGEELETLSVYSVRPAVVETPKDHYKDKERGHSECWLYCKDLRTPHDKISCRTAIPAVQKYLAPILTPILNTVSPLSGPNSMPPLLCFFPSNETPPTIPYFLSLIHSIGIQIGHDTSYTSR